MIQGDMKNKENRIHVHQKPVKLYDWLIKHYAKDAKLILDTHVGSGSSRIAAHKAGKKFTGFEIDRDHWLAQEERYNNFKRQLTLF
jgi:site-specific DNA-methyltransferase (adenine-specific)